MYLKVKLIRNKAVLIGDIFKKYKRKRQQMYNNFKIFLELEYGTEIVYKKLDVSRNDLCGECQKLLA